MWSICLRRALLAPHLILGLWTGPCFLCGSHTGSVFGLVLNAGFHTPQRRWSASVLPRRMFQNGPTWGKCLVPGGTWSHPQLTLSQLEMLVCTFSPQCRLLFFFFSPRGNDESFIAILILTITQSTHQRQKVCVRSKSQRVLFHSGLSFADILCHSTKHGNCPESLMPKLTTVRCWTLNNYTHRQNLLS